MTGCAVFGEDMEEEKACKAFGVDVVGGRDKDTELGETIDDDEDGGKAGGRRKLLNEIHGNGIPRALGDRKGFVKSVPFGVRG